MKKLDKILDNAMRSLMAVAMFALLAGGTWQIFTRWILRNPSTVTDEFLRYVLIWASMIGSAYCFYKDKHLALDLVKGRAKGAFNVVLSVFIEAASVCFVGYVFVYGGWKLTANAPTFPRSCASPSSSCIPSCRSPACSSFWLAC